MKINKYISVLIIIFATVFGLSGCGIQSAQDYIDNQTVCAVGEPKSTAKKLFLESWQVIRDEYYDETYNHQDWNRWKNKYLNKINSKEDAYVAIDTMLESLDDPYTRFLPPQDFKEQNMEIDARLFGIGINIAQIKDNIIVLSVLESTPAEKADIEAGDIILKINQKTAKGISLKKAADLIRGKRGTEVKLTILRDKKTIEKAVKRDEITLKSVSYKSFTNKIGYIRISSFLSNDTIKEFLNAAFKAGDDKGLIIDLRGNPGGQLSNAVLIADMFIDSGTVVSMVDRNDKKTDIKAHKKGILIDKPLVILINKSSASASEILSGALKDHHRAILVGTTTFGKGLIQKIQKLPDNTGLNLTVARYLTPDGTDINKKGIKPDYTIEMTKEDFLKNKDPQLDKAKEIIQKQAVASTEVR
jgi:carboxyl-terminal processing protease